MSRYRRSVSPRAAASDLRAFFAEKREHSWLFLALSVLLALGLMTAVAVQFGSKQQWKEPEVQYVTQWPASRSAEEVRRQQAIDRPAELAAKKAKADAEAKRREQFRRAGEIMKSMGVGS